MAALTVCSLIIIKDCNFRFQGVGTELATPAPLMTNSTFLRSAAMTVKVTKLESCDS